MIYNHPIGSIYHSLRIQSPSRMVIGVYNHLLRKVFRFHYHSQKVIGSVFPNVPAEIWISYFYNVYIYILCVCVFVRVAFCFLTFRVYFGNLQYMN